MKKEQYLKPKWDGIQSIRRYVEPETEEIVMMLGQEDSISEWRWQQIDRVICATKGIEVEASVKDL